MITNILDNIKRPINEYMLVEEKLFKLLKEILENESK